MHDRRVWAHPLEHGQPTTGDNPLENNSPFSRSNQPPIASQLGMGPPVPIPWPHWDLWLPWICAGHYRRLCEFMNAAALPCPGDSVSKFPSLSFCSYIHSVLSSEMFPEPWIGEGVIDMAYLGLQNHSFHRVVFPVSHMLLIITNLYVLQKLAGRLFSSLRLISLSSAIKACGVFEHYGLINS